MRADFIQIRLNLNSYAVNLARDASDNTADVPLNAAMAQAEKDCYQLAIDSLAQLRILYSINPRILTYAQDSMSIMVACEFNFILPSRHDLTMQMLRVSFVL